MQSLTKDGSAEHTALQDVGAGNRSRPGRFCSSSSSSFPPHPGSKSIWFNQVLPGPPNRSTSIADRAGQSRPSSSTAHPFPGRGALARSGYSKILHLVTSDLSVGSRVLLEAQCATHHRRCCYHAHQALQALQTLPFPRAPKSRRGLVNL